MENTSFSGIESIVRAQREFFHSGITLGIDFREKQLRRLAEALQEWEKPLYEALWHDLHKSREEACLTEISIIEGEIKTHLRHLKQWAKPKRRSTPLKMWPSRSYEVSEPLGSALIIAPWNYPVQLLLNPLVGAIAAGCTAILKPSPYVPEVSRVLGEMIESAFDERYIAVVQGNREVNTALLQHRFDIIFFTGSPALGRVVMRAAAEHLTPVVLELGGKSPCIVDKSANLKVAARRIAWGKSLNAGQTCIAPDYIFIHRSVEEEFIKEFKAAIKELLGEDAQQSRHYVRMVSEQAFKRVVSYLDEGDIAAGGTTNGDELYIEPTLLTNVTPSAKVMQEEIFGPVLPMITFSTQEEVIKFINEREKPLALYYFGDEERGWRIISRTWSGGACLNDTIMHIANERLPFGGVGNSGMGCYHGKHSFDAFSHRRAVVAAPTWIDLPFRYMPYKLFSIVKRLL